MVAKTLVTLACFMAMLVLGSTFLSLSGGSARADNCQQYPMGSQSWARCMNGPTSGCPACGINCGEHQCYREPDGESGQAAAS